MNIAGTPWHRESFDRLLKESLPALLAERLPLAAWHSEPTGEHTFRATVVVSAAGGEVTVTYDALPQPDLEGVFEIQGRRVVVEPLVSDPHLDTATVKCVGEQLYDFFEQRLGKAPPDLDWTEEVVRSIFPLDGWFRAFFSGADDFSVEKHDDQEQFWFPVPFGRRDNVGELDATNCLARQAHLRRIRVDKPASELLRKVDFRSGQRGDIYPAGQIGRACPFETPEGSDVGRVLHLARGAAIRGGRIVIVDDTPAAALGLTAGCVPFLEHSDANRLTMGVNTMRQWLPPPDPEPAMVQTGLEPTAPEFWCGRNLLTAFIPWGVDTYEDAIVVSESAAGRLGYPAPLEPGDKLANRHGQKGVVSRILSDDQMPHLGDGTPVDLVYNFIGLHTRLNYGQLREAVMGRVAKAMGRPVLVAPFAAPKDERFRKMLVESGLTESGMETLREGRNGPPLDRPSTSGWVYWGKTFHTAGPKMRVSVAPPWATRQATMEYAAMRDVGAFANVLNMFNAASMDRPDAATLAERVAGAPIQPASPPTPAFDKLERGLSAAGVRAELRDQEVRFSFMAPAENVLRLARAMPHPWFPAHEVDRVGRLENVPAFTKLEEANSRLSRMLAGGVPSQVAQKAVEHLGACMEAYLEELVAPSSLQLGNAVLFSGRAVICPDGEMSLDQVGIPEEMAWTLFGPLAAGPTLGNAQAKSARRTAHDKSARRTAHDAAERSQEARQTLDGLMSESWVIANRAPALTPAALVAFHPVRRPGRVIRLHPLVTPWMNADYDGDQVAILLPLTEEAQRDAGEKLSVRGHLQRDHSLIRWMAPHQDILWALADRSRTLAGRQEIESLVGRPLAAPNGFLTVDSFRTALRAILEQEGIDRALDLVERLARLGFALARRSGASLHPMLGSALERPRRDREHMTEFVESFRDFDNPAFGPQALAVKTGARGNVQQQTMLLGGPSVGDFQGRIITVEGGLCDGRSPEETFVMASGARAGLAATARDVLSGTYEFARSHYGWSPSGVRGYGVLARAMRSRRPGIVFAHAAASAEHDPLTDLDARLFVGMMPLGHD